MQRLTDWQQKDLEGNPITCYYYYNEPNLIVVRGDELPEDSQEVINQSDVMMCYNAKGRKYLQPQSRAVYDFLKGRGL